MTTPPLARTILPERRGLFRRRWHAASTPTGPAPDAAAAAPEVPALPEQEAGAEAERRLREESLDAADRLASLAEQRGAVPAAATSAAGWQPVDG